MTRVVHHHKYTGPDKVYIGRGGPFGNPHIIGYCSICKAIHGRNAAIAAYKKYFLERIETDQEFKKQVLQLSSKNLACFCKPEPCHGDVIKEWLDQQMETNYKSNDGCMG